MMVNSFSEKLKERCKTDLSEHHAMLTKEEIRAKKEQAKLDAKPMWRK